MLRDLLPRSRDARIAVLILAVGWAAALVAYATSDDVPVDPEVYEVEHSRSTARDLERIGGKSAVVASELNDAIASLWEGTHRAYTLGALTVAAALGFLLFRRRSRGSEPDGERSDGSPPA